MDKFATILQTEHLNIGYTNGRNQQAVLSDLNLTAAAGLLHCLLGINGIGKSTLLRTLAGLQAPLTGQVIVDQLNIEQYNNLALAKKIAVVLTKQGINAAFSVTELVEMGRYPYTSWTGKLQQADTDKVNESITLCEIEDIAHKSIHEISDGQFQKTLIARALAQDCPIIMLDEPTNHLDPNNRFIIIQLLKKIAHNANKCIIMSTHQVEMATELADIIWLAKANATILTDTREKMVSSGVIKEVFPYVWL